MTQKELLYVEDALSHLKYMQTKCKDVATNLQDADLRTYVEQLESKHKQLFDSLYGLLNC